MKTLLQTLFVLTLFFTSQNTRAQFVTIPDPNFVAWLTSNGFASSLNGNDLDTTHALVTGTTIIDCSSSSIGDLEGIQYFDNLVQLIASYNSLVLIPALPGGLQVLNLSDNQISTVNNLPSGLQVLEISSNNLISLQTLPLNLTELYCNYNQLAVLPNLPPTLKILDCSGNLLLTNLPNLPSGLLTLNCANNSLAGFPTLPNSLVEFNCGGNNLTNLPPLPTNLISLSCHFNSLSSLPILPNGILELDCHANLISSISVLPSNLEYFNCQGNLLTNLPAIPSNLQMLYADQNQLTIIPYLPASMTYLSASNNQLTFVVNFPDWMTYIGLSSNNLTTLPELPDQVSTLDISNNPNFSCLPALTDVGFLNYTSTALQCFPNYSGLMNIIPPTLLPLCDLLNVNGCGFYYNIAGTVFPDSNSNCISDSGEYSVPGIKINLYSSGTLVQQNYTSLLGHYTFDTQLGSFDYAPDTISMPFQVACPAQTFLTSVLTISDSIDFDMNFGLICKPGFDIGVDVVLNTDGWFFPGDTAALLVRAGDLSQLFNLNCATGTNGTVTVFFTGPVQYGGNAPGSLTPAVSLNTLTYTIADFGQIDIENDFRFNLITDTTAQSGQQVCISVDVTPTSGDQNPGNNMYTHCFPTVNSFDPNEKSCNPIGIITGDSWLTYTIRFQNTGTAPAQHIMITDTLDSDVQEGTFSFLTSSHNPFVNVTGNVVKFTFPNINLPDSTTNEPGSHGYVQYRVKSDAGLALGTTIENTANIYFDFNPPVITNTTVNTVVMPTDIPVISNPGFTLFPNPSSDIINITLTQSGLNNINIYDMTGRNIYQQSNAVITVSIDIKSLPEGSYVVELIDEHQLSYRQLFIKY